MGYNLKEIFKQFDINNEVSSYGNGHINDTYICKDPYDYILQRINTNVFNKPWEVMENICNVTEHVGKKIASIGGNPDRETLTVIPTVDGKQFYKDDQNNYFRVYKFISNSRSYDLVENPKHMYEAGLMFGKFQNMLSDFPADKLHETIIDFHNTPVRVKQLETAIEKNLSGRLESVAKEVDFAKEYGNKYAGLIMDAMADGTVPTRVTHNDTKLNNILFDADTDKGICVIDLDTVMPGSLLWDFGDALRFGASSGVEDETDLDKIWFDLEKFEAFAKGFLEETADCITKKEAELLPVSALIMTYECGIRFLADHINGDTYFKVHRENHNLDRTRNQFKLVSDIEAKLDEMHKIVSKYI